MPTFVRCLVPVFACALVLGGCDSGVGGRTSTLGDNTTVAFTAAAAGLGEGGGAQTVEIIASDPGYKRFTFALRVNQEESTASLGADVQGLPADTLLRFPQSTTDGQTQSFSFEVVDDSVTDGDETLIVSLAASDTSGTAIGEQATFTLDIADNDLLSAAFADSTLSPMQPYSVASQNDWATSSEGDPPNAPYASASGFGGNEPANDWLISPALNFNALQNETLTFLNAKGFDDSGRRGLQVKVSTEYDGAGNPENVAWTDVSDQVTFSTGNFTFVRSGAVDLSASVFQSDSTYVAFQYRSSGTGGGSAATWQVDNAVVTGTVANP